MREAIRPTDRVITATMTMRTLVLGTDLKYVMAEMFGKKTERRGQGRLHAHV